MRLSIVDLPEPDAPIMETISPLAMERETWSRAMTLRFPSNCLDTFWRSIIVNGRGGGVILLLIVKSRGAQRAGTAA